MKAFSRVPAVARQAAKLVQVVEQRVLPVALQVHPEAVRLAVQIQQTEPERPEAVQKLVAERRVLPAALQVHRQAALLPVPAVQPVAELPRRHRGSPGKRAVRTQQMEPERPEAALTLLAAQQELPVRKAARRAAMGRRRRAQEQTLALVRPAVLRRVTVHQPAAAAALPDYPMDRPRAAVPVASQVLVHPLAHRVLAHRVRAAGPVAGQVEVVP